MLYTEFIQKAMNETIVQSDNGLFYLEPLWRTILYDSGLDVNNIKDAAADWSSILDVLRLEVEKRNTINSKKNDVIEWVYNVISTTVDPAILEQETEYIKAIIDKRKES